jgi:hypothetical protein
LRLGLILENLIQDVVGVLRQGVRPPGERDSAGEEQGKQ